MDGLNYKWHQITLGMVDVFMRVWFPQLKVSYIKQYINESDHHVQCCYAIKQQ